MLGRVVAAMHYIGMAAFRIQGYVLWDKAYVLASVVIGVGLSAAASGRDPATAAPGCGWRPARACWRSPSAACTSPPWRRW